MVLKGILISGRSCEFVSNVLSWSFVLDVSSVFDYFHRRKTPTFSPVGGVCPRASTNTSHRKRLWHHSYLTGVAPAIPMMPKFRQGKTSCSVCCTPPATRIRKVRFGPVLEACGKSNARPQAGMDVHTGLGDDYHMLFHISCPILKRFSSLYTVRLWLRSSSSLHLRETLGSCVAHHPPTIALPIFFCPIESFLSSPPTCCTPPLPHAN